MLRIQQKAHINSMALKQRPNWWIYYLSTTECRTPRAGSLLSWYDFTSSRSSLCGGNILPTKVQIDIYTLIHNQTSDQTDHVALENREVGLIFWLLIAGLTVFAQGGPIHSQRHGACVCVWVCAIDINPLSHFNDSNEIFLTWLQTVRRIVQCYTTLTRIPVDFSLEYHIG